MEPNQGTLRRIVDVFPEVPADERERRLQEWGRELLTIVSEERKRLAREEPPSET